MSKRSPSVIEPLDDMWWCNKKQKFKNELDVYSMYLIIPFFLHKMLAPHRQPTFRDRRWTKYSNLEERIGRHPLPQISKIKNMCVTCHAVGFDLFCPPVSTLGRRKHLWNLGGAGDKVVQGLNNLSIYCMYFFHVLFKCHSQVGVLRQCNVYENHEEVQLGLMAFKFEIRHAFDVRISAKTLFWFAGVHQ